MDGEDITPHMSTDCNGYMCYLHNRNSWHRNAPKASGGYIKKDMLFDEYKIEIIDNDPQVKKTIERLGVAAT